jgi:hypothetical protein
VLSPGKVGWIIDPAWLNCNTMPDIFALSSIDAGKSRQTFQAGSAKEQICTGLIGHAWRPESGFLFSIMREME